MRRPANHRLGGDGGVTVSAVDDVSTGVPFTDVVVVIEYVPAQVRIGTRKGIEMVCWVLGGNVNGGVVNISVSPLPQLLGCSGPVKVNLILTFCAVLAQDINVPLMIVVPPCGTVDRVGTMET